MGRRGITNELEPLRPIDLKITDRTHEWKGEQMANEIYSKRVAEMTGAEARRVIISGVANGAILAGLIIVLLNFALGFVVGDLK